MSERRNFLMSDHKEFTEMMGKRSVEILATSWAEGGSELEAVTIVWYDSNGEPHARRFAPTEADPIFDITFEN